MTSLDADAIRDSIGEAAATRLAGFETFSEIESTNSYLMQQDCPLPGWTRIAITDNQTMGRGRHGRTWQSPPGSGLCLSMAYTFRAQPADLSALTLAIGLGAIEALEHLGVDGVQLKWPNDLIANDGKLGGILTESRMQTSGAITIVTGVGLNVDLDAELDFGPETDQARRVADITGIAGVPPDREHLAARLIDALHAAFVDFEADGFGRYVEQWRDRDWLLGREVTIDTSRRQVTGTGAGIADDGALLIDTGSGVVRRITSGSVVMAGVRDGDA